MAHIGIDARLVDYRPGGISTYARRMIDAMEGITMPHRVTVFQSRQAQERLSQQFDHARLWTPPHHRWERTALSVELSRYHLDLFHSLDFIPPRRGARRHVITVHDLTFLHYSEHKDAASLRYYRDQIEVAVQQADAILAVSSATQRDLVQMLNVPEERITVQPHGIDPRFHPMDPTGSWRHHLDLPLGYILHVGTLEPRKNIPLLLDAYERIDSPPPLVLVGQIGWLFEETMARIEAMQADGHEIILRSDITDDALPAVYNAARVVVMTSHYEGFGLPLLEAMACGTPVVATNVSAMPEVVSEAGMLVEPNEPEILAKALRVALRDNDWRMNARRKGLLRAETYTWENSARIAHFVYQRLLQDIDG
jgi:glycosyltransferase involved in cell wall biosynthesis